jgi:SAM-dependent methyltransferase
VPEQPTQREYWSGKVGGEWARYTERIDAQLAPIAEATLQAGAFRPGERVIDIGCGSGGTSLDLARLVAPTGAVIGVDLSPQMLDVARERARNTNLPVEFLEADAGTATFSQPFDAAFSRFGVMFFDAPTPAFAHIRTMIRPDGRLIFACWRQMPENDWATLPIAAVEPMLKAPLQRPDPDAPGPYAFSDPEKVERILRDSGWRDIAIAHWDGALSVGGGGAIEDIADFLLKIGPCARAIADQGLDSVEARQRLIDRLAPRYRDNAVMLSAACWIVTARA